MELSGAIIGAGEAVLRELALFAACGFLLLGLGDLLVDFIWIGRELKRLLVLPRRKRACAQSLAAPVSPGRFAIFVPAWQEAEVIGGMLDHAARAFAAHDHVIYVGCYPNDEATIHVVRALEGERVRLVVGPVWGPTNKADCLNRLWERMRRDEADEGRPFKAVVLHDAEDVVHSAELKLFDTLVERFDLVQLPVVPLIDAKSRWVAGSYIDEFLESHGKELIVREAIGASVPSAGVGCAIRCGVLDALAARHGMPFDPGSLTEDYELGLRIRDLGHRGAFVRLPGRPGRPVVATREHFPSTIKAAIRQKSRWIAGIALSGWDRLGWRGGLAERWMRLRDRQSLLAALILFVAYCSFALWGALSVGALVSGQKLKPFPAYLELLLTLNMLLFAWRMSMRFGFVAEAYGWREGLRAIPRTFVSNLIAMLAAREAVSRYLEMRRTGTAAWDKTDHAFPAQLPAE